MVWQIGPMARRLDDLCAMMPVLLGADGCDHNVVDMPYLDPAQVRVRDLRVAFHTDNGIAPVGAETAAVVRAAAQTLSSEGLRVEERRPPGIEQSYDLEMKMIGPDGGDGLRHFLHSAGSTRTNPLLDQWLSKLEPFRTTLDGFAEYWNSLFEFRAGTHAFFQMCRRPSGSVTVTVHGLLTESSLERRPANRCPPSKSTQPRLMRLPRRPWKL